MKPYYFGLIFMIFIWILAGSWQLSTAVRNGKSDPPYQEAGQAQTVTVLNPALFHRLNAILEQGIIKGE